MDWRDLRFALAVAQRGTLADAARALTVDPTTVSRRLSALEEDLGAPIFVRHRARWRPTEVGRVVLRRAERMAAEARALRHDAERVTATVHGGVRITAVDGVLSAWVVPAMASLRVRHPELTVELLATNANVDLTRGHADVALRLARPTQAGLLVRKVADISLVIAAHPTLMERPLAERPLVLLGYTDSDLPENRLIRGHGGPVACTATSMNVCFALVSRGLGVGLYTRRQAEARGLVVLDEIQPGRRLWRAAPEEIADAPRIRAVTDWIDGVFAALG